jgi:hypothetical protein
MNDSFQAGESRPVVLYIKTALSSLTAMILAASLPMLWTGFRSISQGKATGLAAVGGKLFENVFSGWYLILFLLLLAIFFITGRLGNRTQRILLFWVPTITVCGFALSMWALLAYAMRHIPSQ